MTITELPVGRLDALESKIDHLTDQIAVLTADAERRSRQRAAIEDFTSDMARVSGDAMAAVSRELESLSQTADLGDALRLLRRLVEVAPTLERSLVALDQVASFVDDAAPLGTDVMTLVTERLAEFERAGYFTFARAGAQMADRIVTNFDEDDLAQLGDNIVVILETIREITQPDMLALLGRMVTAVKAEQELVAAEAADPPTLWQLARQVRDPDVRRGMGRALHTLKSVAADTGPQRSDTAATDTTTTTTTTTADPGGATP